MPDSTSWPGSWTRPRPQRGRPDVCRNPANRGCERRWVLVAGVPPDATSPEIWQAHESLKPAAPLHGRRPRGRADRAHRVCQAHGSRRRTRCELAARGSRRPAAGLLGRSQPLDRCGAPNSRVHHCRQRDQPLSRTDRSDPRRLLERHLWRRSDEAVGLRTAGAGPPGGQPGVSTSRWPACWMPSTAPTTSS